MDGEIPNWYPGLVLNLLIAIALIIPDENKSALIWSHDDNQRANNHNGLPQTTVIYLG